MPASHIAHTATPVAPVMLEYVPAAHGVQAAAPTPEYVPAAHDRHTLAPSPEYVPWPHVAHVPLVVAAVAAEYVPAPHNEHASLPGSKSYVPTGHASHRCVSPFHVYPAAHTHTPSTSTLCASQLHAVPFHA